MKLEIDHEKDVAYLYLRDDVQYGESVRQSWFEWRQSVDRGAHVVVDWDENAAIIGFEFIGAKALLGPAYPKGEEK